MVNPLAARRRLGTELRRLRTNAGLTLDEVAERMTCSTSKISRLETGKGIPKVPDVNELARIYGVIASAEREMLMRLVREGREHGWWEKLTDGVHPERFVLNQPGRYVALEHDASQVNSFESTLVPGLLQTERYAREVLSAALPNHPSEAIGRLVELRMRRREAFTRLDREPLEVEVVLDEAVLHRAVGGPDVMAEQLRFIDTLIDQDNVYVQVLPFSAGVLRAHLGQFVILRFPPVSGPDIVYLEGHAGDIHLDNGPDVDLYKKVFTGARRASLSSEASRVLIRQHAARHAAQVRMSPP